MRRAFADTSLWSLEEASVRPSFATSGVAQVWSVRTRSDITNAYWCIRILMPSKISSNAMYITYIYIYTHYITYDYLRLAKNGMKFWQLGWDLPRPFRVQVVTPCEVTCQLGATLRGFSPLPQPAERRFASHPGCCHLQCDVWIWPKRAKTNQHHPNPCDERGGECIWPSKKSQ